MTITDKLQAILDLVLQNPLQRQVSTDPDGKKTVTYTQQPLPAPVDLSFIPESQNDFNFEIGPPYRKHQLVRFQEVDYLAVEDTNSTPPSASWVVARINQIGAAGYDGNIGL